VRVNVWERQNETRAWLSATCRNHPIQRIAAEPPNDGNERTETAKGAGGGSLVKPGRPKQQGRALLSLFGRGNLMPPASGPKGRWPPYGCGAAVAFGQRGGPLGGGVATRPKSLCTASLAPLHGTVGTSVARCARTQRLSDTAVRGSAKVAHTIGPLRRSGRPKIFIADQCTRRPWWRRLAG
jgi:hypothetical protein